MAQTGRSGLSAAQQGELWHRWKAGQSMSEIGRALGRDHSSIYYLLSYRGGIVPAVRRRARIALTLAEREDSSRGIAAGWSIRGTAERLGRSALTVSRELARHGGPSRYRAAEADYDAWESALRPKLCLLAVNGKLQRIVASKLSLDC